MGNFKKKGGFGGGNFRDSSFGAKRSNARPGNRDFRESKMFSTTCDECGKTCEVPFRPTGDKPVYCSYCFSKHKEDGSNDFSRNNDRRNDQNRREGNSNFRNRENSFARISKPQVDNTIILDLKKQIEFVNNKLDKVMELLKRNDSFSVKVAPENKVDVKALSAVVKKVVTAPKAPAKKVVASAKKPTKVVKKGKK